jgi:hypothetical protein
MGRGAQLAQVSLLRSEDCCRGDSSNEDAALGRGSTTTTTNGTGGGTSSTAVFLVELMCMGNLGGEEDLSLLLLLTDALHLDRSQLFEPLFEPLFGGEDNDGESLPLLALVVVLFLFSQELSNAISSCQADGIWALSTTMSMGLSSKNCWRNEFIFCVMVGACLDYASLLLFFQNCENLSALFLVSSTPRVVSPNKTVTPDRQERIRFRSCFGGINNQHWGTTRHAQRTITYCLK